MTDITSSLRVEESFSPPSRFQQNAIISSPEQYEDMWKKAKDHPDDFWREKANEFLHWHKPFSKILEWNEPFAKWFGDGELNASYNCLDRHLPIHGEKIALFWEGEPGEQRQITYRELHQDVCRFANGLKSLGLKKGDVATIYMPMVPELVVALLACSRLGITHSVIFGGFSADAIADRNQDAGAKVVITADGGWRRGKIIPLKENVDVSLAKSSTVRNVVVLKRTRLPITMQRGRDHDWHELVRNASLECPAKPMNSEHPLFILYTSGSTGKPKGILHTTGGYLLNAAMTTKYVFDLKENDIYWCTADVGWITGHTYTVYGPLANAATVVMYEGAPDFPDFGRIWQIIEKWKVTILYTAPTAIRAFMKAGEEFPNRSDLSSLRLLGSVGEPINPAAWLWYHEKIGGTRCPIVDTWWQTETGSIMISPLPGATTTFPGSATKPMFGVVAEIVDSEGREVGPNQGGYLVISRPWPSMLRSIFGDDERYRKVYWSQIKGKYFSGDGARRDDHGNFWIMGRIDDVLNVAGHRLSTMEIESSLVQHESVAEAAVVGFPHERKGEGIFCFVTLENSFTPSDELRDRLIAHVGKHIGAIAKPDEIKFTSALPKTRSGKIMRRLLRDIAAGRETTQDTTTLEDRGVLDSLRDD